jgi:hypothetical protein
MGNFTFWTMDHFIVSYLNYIFIVLIEYNKG